MMSLFAYDFIMRGATAGIIIAIIAPVIGIFLVLRRYSMIADTLSHVSLSGIALGLLLGINPLITAILTTVISSIAIERLRSSKKVYGESALALFLSGSLALAVVLLSLTRGLNASLFSFLFGSIATVSNTDIITVGVTGILVFLAVSLLYKELVYISFDEESAQVSGIKTSLLNTIFIALTALTISISIPVVGVLLISALLTIPVISAMQFGKALIPTIVIAQVISVGSVILGILASFYLDLAPGGIIVLTTIFFFFVTQVLTHKS
jgi:zinc transport system permease protein